MISIINVSKKYLEVGWQTYEVRINDTVLSKFKHRSEEGIVKCLELAAKSLINYEMNRNSKDVDRDDMQLRNLYFKFKY